MGWKIKFDNPVVDARTSKNPEMVLDKNSDHSQWIWIIFSMFESIDVAADIPICSFKSYLTI